VLKKTSEKIALVDGNCLESTAAAMRKKEIRRVWSWKKSTALNLQRDRTAVEGSYPIHRSFLIMRSHDPCVSQLHSRISTRTFLIFVSAVGHDELSDYGLHRRFCGRTLVDLSNTLSRTTSRLDCGSKHFVSTDIQWPSGATSFCLYQSITQQ
jgi:hypothetical protein